MLRSIVMVIWGCLAGIVCMWATDAATLMSPAQPATFSTCLDRMEQYAGHGLQVTIPAQKPAKQAPSNRDTQAN